MVVVVMKLINVILNAIVFVVVVIPLLLLLLFLIVHGGDLLNGHFVCMADGLFFCKYYTSRKSHSKGDKTTLHHGHFHLRCCLWCREFE
jgi:hypothetical protein